MGIFDFLKPNTEAPTTITKDKERTLIKVTLSEVDVPPNLIGSTVSEAVAALEDDLEIDSDQTFEVNVNGRSESLNYMIQKGDEIILRLALGSKGV